MLTPTSYLRIHSMEKNNTSLLLLDELLHGSIDEKKDREQSRRPRRHSFLHSFGVLFISALGEYTWRQYMGNDVGSSSKRGGNSLRGRRGRRGR